MPDPAALTAMLTGERLLRLGDTPPDLPSIPGAAVYIPTSGSTSGRPRVVALSPDNLRRGAAATASALGGPGGWLAALDAGHVAGLLVHTRALLAGLPVVTLTGPFRPATFAAGVAELRAAAPGVRHYCSLVPTQLVRVLADPAATAAAAALTALLVGGAGTPAPLLDRAAAAGVRVVTSYGMTESTGGCVYDGVALPGTAVTLADDGAAGGRIALTGAQIALGYVEAGGLAAFHGRFTTADRGRIVAGRLEVVGRVDDVILSGGVNVDPHQVEAVIARVPGVAETAVVGAADPHWGAVVCAAVVPHAEAPRDLTDRVRAAVAATLPPTWVPRRIALRDSLPVRGPGKIDRRALADSFGADGTTHEE